MKTVGIGGLSLFSIVVYYRAINQLTNEREETAKEFVKQAVRKVGLLGTKFTMEHSFFKELLSNYDINNHSAFILALQNV